MSLWFVPAAFSLDQAEIVIFLTLPIFSHSRIFRIKKKKREILFFSGMMSGSSRKGGKRFQVLSDDRDAETMIETASTTGSVASLGFVS